MEGQEQQSSRADEAQISSLVSNLQDRKIDTQDSNDIAYQASFMPIGAEDDFVGEGHVVRIKRDAAGLHIISSRELSTNE